MVSVLFHWLCTLDSICYYNESRCTCNVFKTCRHLPNIKMHNIVTEISGCTTLSQKYQDAPHCHRNIQQCLGTWCCQSMYCSLFSNSPTCDVMLAVTVTCSNTLTLYHLTLDNQRKDARRRGPTRYAVLATRGRVISSHRELGCKTKTYLHQDGVLCSRGNAYGIHTFSVMLARLIKHTIVNLW